MADVTKATETALVPLKPLADLQLKVKELDVMGRGTEYTVDLPSTVEYEKLTVPQKICLMKMGAHKASSIGMIMSMIIKAAELRRKTGADIDELAGDIYAIGEGRMALSNKAKIKIANATGRIEGVEWEVTPEDTEVSLTGYDGPELICTCTVYVKGFKKPVVLTQHLSEWYMPSNPNWRTRPEHMLRLNTYAHACEFIFPMDNSDDAPLTSAPEQAKKTAEELIAEVAST